MASYYTLAAIVCILLFFVGSLHQCSAAGTAAAVLSVNASEASGKKISDNLFGVFWEEINHAGQGGLWAELVSNRGFEAKNGNNTVVLDPWITIGNPSFIRISTESSSMFEKNKIALKMEVLCGDSCPPGGVGISNPGFWGMNIVKDKLYKVSFYVRSIDPIDSFVSLVGSNGRILARKHIRAYKVSSWRKMEFDLKAEETDENSSLQFTTSKKGVLWLDQVSVMPQDTYKGHGFRTDLIELVQNLKPRFLRFPGGCFVEGRALAHALVWKDTIGPQEERPGHLNDIWDYWTDDGLGHYEGFLLAEDLGALPIWVFSVGISVMGGEVNPDKVAPLVQDALDGIEFAVGSADSTWGSVRAKMGHPQPFDLRYVAVGNEDCGKPSYMGNYKQFYDAIRKAYPKMKIISNCDGSTKALPHPADIYDYHTYPNANGMFAQYHHFDNSPRNGPKAFVSEYATFGPDAGQGSLLGALAESAFLMGLEKNSDAVELASYAPLFSNVNDKKWIPNAIYFDSSEAFATPSYYMQQFFIESNGATYLDSALTFNGSLPLVASAIVWQEPMSDRHLRVKVVNFGNSTVNLNILLDGLVNNAIQPNSATKTEMTSALPTDGNSFAEPKKIAPVKSGLPNSRGSMNVVLSPYSLNSFDYLLEN